MYALTIFLSTSNYVLFFFFSSRRRHTRVSGDWSSDVCSSDLEVHPGHSREACMALMTDQRVRHLVVTDGGRLVGMISIGDLVKDTLDEQRFTIEQLEHYIAGDRGVPPTGGASGEGARFCGRGPPGKGLTLRLMGLPP